MEHNYVETRICVEMAHTHHFRRMSRNSRLPDATDAAAHCMVLFSVHV
jgi:hypothetical protein